MTDEVTRQNHERMLEERKFHAACQDRIQSLEREVKELRSPDSNVEANRELLLQRSRVGIRKYGVTTDMNPLSLKQWLQHALEETLDHANYLQAAMKACDTFERNLASRDEELKTARALAIRAFHLVISLSQPRDPDEPIMTQVRAFLDDEELKRLRATS